MFDQVPVRVWLLILIGIWAYPAITYAYRHVAHSPSGRDVAQPKENLDWRTPTRLALSVVALAFLAMLAGFIFTPQAEEFANSPSFWPLLMVIMAAFVAFTTVRGFLSGEVEPIVKGSFGPYRRSDKPRRYWASMTWNVVFTFLCLFLATKI